ncbi:phosphatidate cytidylyltransferase [Anaeromicropila herbilytica]|uniref:Phosphatidate cytidylyltransferase n=1 Tax=Anaeromicropila herbilytica TaxID=2785025 RepID=A0A7R7EMH4_9FIRM|nr:phosphatidate cytidylyltransferase [Anaeromicropila herbilytica]BCN31483.1 phosphatidate cytidylyltransferase [Anaeromicropila herbilytica]
MLNTFLIRLRSSIILMIITLFTVIMGGNILFATVAIISLIGLTELFQVGNIKKTILGIITCLASLAYDFMILLDKEDYIMMLFIAFLLLLLFSYVFTFPKYNTEQVTLAFFGFFYVSLMLSYIYKVRVLEDGAILVWLIFIGAWGSDTFAYLSGILLGKHKITPKLSPKKSLEGCIGGVLGAALIGFIYALVFKGYLTHYENPMLAFAIIGAASSVVSQIGDLAASAIKRNHDIKDYGTLIPGHGGILDRFDSIIITAPIVYFLATSIL